MSRGDGFPEVEAGYYEACADGTVACRLCPHECRIAEGRHGRCRSRVNRGGKLYALAYGRACALAADPVEKKPLFHFLPGTRCLSVAAAGCNLACLNCQNWTLSQASPLEAEHRRLMPEELPGMAVRAGCGSVAYTYTEPLTYLEYTLRCARACRERGLRNLLVTAGYVNPQPLADLLPWIDATNVDLKSLSDETYRRVSQAHLQPVLRTLRQVREADVWLEITHLVIPSVNDSEAQLRDLCRWLVDNGFGDCPLHLSRFFPAYRLRDVPATPLETLLSARRIAGEAGMRYVYMGNVFLPGAEDTRCPRCGERLIGREGYRISTHGFAGACPCCGFFVPGVWE